MDENGDVRGGFDALEWVEEIDGDEYNERITGIEADQDQADRTIE